MTVPMFDGYLTEIAATEAERALLLAEALHPTKESLARLLAQARGQDDMVVGRLRHRFNGEPVSMRELRQRLRLALGGGFRAA